jgi:hypothetical protein
VHHPTAGVAPVTTGTGPISELVPRPGQGLVRGLLTSLTSDNAQADPLHLPLTVTIPNRGQGGATITPVVVAGQQVSIGWYGGQPLPVSGDGTIDLAGAPVKIDGSAVTWSLDGAPRGLTLGHYLLGAPVAVGAGGLGTPRDSVSFEATPSSTIETTGGATVRLGGAPLHLEGPGRLTLGGRLSLRTPTTRRDVTAITFGPGDYELDLAPAPGGYTIDAIVQGSFSAS